MQRDGYDFRFLEEKDIDRVIEFMEKVYNNIENKETFAVTEREELEDILKRGGVILAGFYENEIIAIRISTIPKDSDNLAHDVEIFDIDKDKVIINDTVMVHEDHRGKNLQNITREISLDYLSELGFTDFMSTISPYNIASFKNTVNSGYAIVALKKKYPDEKNPDGYYRFILHKSDYEKYSFLEEEISVNPTDIYTIKDLLEKNFVGTDVIDNQIIFKKINISKLK